MTLHFGIMSWMELAIVVVLAGIVMLVETWR
jgi:hypothetical protein